MDCRCELASVTLYTQNQDWTDAKDDDNSPDVTICERDQLTHTTYVSDGPRTVIKFESHEMSLGMRGNGFKANVSFSTGPSSQSQMQCRSKCTHKISIADFGIAGKVVYDQNQCVFEFASGTSDDDEIHSPRYPANVSTPMRYRMP